MITIKKYPNRRLYNTATSTYINLEGIQNLILEGETVVIVDSKTGENVTTATLLLHALEPTVIEALIPSERMQKLMRMGSNDDRLSSIQGTTMFDDESESDTQPEEKTLPKVATVQPGDMIVSSLIEGDSESSDSDSEVTVVRGDDPPTEPVAKHDSRTPIDVQVSMDAWRGREDVEDSEIPSFWSDTAFESSSLDEEFDQSESSDDGLFDQPETVVVQNREGTVAIGSQVSEQNLERDSLDTDIGQPLEEDFSEESSESDSSSDSHESNSSESLSSSVSQTEYPQLDLESPVENNTQLEGSDLIKESDAVEVVSTGNAEGTNTLSKSDQMKARLAAMRAKLKR
jgi:polyhydroxyalkanoate synthesis repressor PhaR